MFASQRAGHVQDEATRPFHQLVLASRELHTAIDRLVDQAGRGVEGSAADAVSPEMRALMKAALSGAVSMARNEIARELAGPQAAPVLNP